MTTAGCVSLLHGNALSIPLADQSVHLIISSPPYFALRSYRDGDEHYDGQLGSEESSHRFLAALWAVMDECWRVLRDDGNCWINLGDKMSGSGGHNNDGISAKSTLSGNGHTGGVSKAGEPNKVKATKRSAPDRYNQNSGDLRAKSRMLLPHRFALGMIDPDYRAFEEHRAGLTPTTAAPQWICRMDVTQKKLNGLPESVTDRVRASHETWFHLTKSERYFAAMDEIREESTPQGGLAGTFKRSKSSHDLVPGQTARQHREDRGADDAYNPLGKLPGSVWEWANEPLILPPDLPQHFAAFASWPVKRIVLGWSPSGVCVACGQPRRPICEKSANGKGRSTTTARDPSWVAINRADWTENVTRTITGYACACPTPDAPTRSSVILDPFSGTGTAPIVAAALGRHGIGVDLSWDYHRIARWRDRDGGLRAKALGVEKPPKQVAGQGSLFDGIAHLDPFPNADWDALAEDEAETRALLDGESAA